MRAFGTIWVSSMDYPLLSAISLFVCAGIVWVAVSWSKRPFADIPGPNARSWLFGNMLEFSLSTPYGTHEFEWQRRFGSVYAIKGCFGTNRLVLSDPVALRHVLSDIRDFGKTPQHQFANKHVLGTESIFHVQGQEHRRLRNAMLPAFSNSALRPMIPRLQNIAEELRTKLEELLQQDPEASSSTVIDVLPVVHESTLKAVTALVGYDMSMDSAFVDSYRHIVVKAAKRSKMAYLVRAMFMALPEVFRDMLKYVPSADFASLMAFRAVSHDRADILVEEKLRARSLGTQSGEESTFFAIMLDTYTTKPGILTLREIKEQFASITVAGEDTTANSILWALFEISRHPDWQDRLREEVASASESKAHQTSNFYDTMSCLNAIIKEVLRLYSAVPYTERVALRDTVVPISRPVMSRMKKGVSNIPVKKGQHVQLAISSYNRLKDIWGDDADQFNPSRWLQDTPADMSAFGALGPYANILSFLGGTHTCIGWRFAVLQIQVHLSELVARLRFELPSSAAITPVHAVSLVPINRNLQEHIEMRLKVSPV